MKMKCKWSELTIMDMRHWVIEYDNLIIRAREMMHVFLGNTATKNNSQYTHEELIIVMLSALDKVSKVIFSMEKLPVKDRLQEMIENKEILVHLCHECWDSSLKEFESAKTE